MLALDSERKFNTTKIPNYYIVIYNNPSNVVSLFIFFFPFTTKYYNKLLSKSLLLPLSHPCLGSKHTACRLMHRLTFRKKLVQFFSCPKIYNLMERI